MMVFISSCSDIKVKDKVSEFLINRDNAELWDCYYTNSFTGKVNKISYLFYKDGRCELYNIGVGNKKRLAQYSDRPYWRMINDSVIEMLCYERYNIVSFGDDSIVMKKTDDPGINLMYTFYRVKEDWKLDGASIKRRDSLEQTLKNRVNPCVIY